MASVTRSLGDPYVGSGGLGNNRWWCGLLGRIVRKIVEEGRAFDPFAFAAEGHLHEFGDAVLLRLDGASELTDEREEFLDLGVELGIVGEQVGHLLAEGTDFVFA